jgi:hypothetical protein
VPTTFVAQKPSGPFFCQSNSILFQLILHEFFQTRIEINAAKKALQGIAFFRGLSQDDFERFFKFMSHIDHHRSNLTRVTIKKAPHGNLNFLTGSLDKLLIYFQTFQDNYPLGNKYTLSISKEIYACFRTTLELEDILPSDGCFSPDKILKKVHKLLQKLEGSIKRIEFPLLSLIEAFRSDENVFLFILRHQLLFEKYFGKGALARLITKLFPEGIKEFHHFLNTAYLNRGFKHIQPSINQWIEELQKKVDEGSTSIDR